ncbi:hypothetical protein COBT_001684 [Conglomerata obtusa]
MDDKNDRKEKDKRDGRYVPDSEEEDTEDKNLDKKNDEKKKENSADKTDQKSKNKSNELDKERKNKNEINTTEKKTEDEEKVKQQDKNSEKRTEKTPEKTHMQNEQNEMKGDDLDAEEYDNAINLNEDNDINGIKPNDSMVGTNLNNEKVIEDKNINMALIEADVKEGDVVEVTYNDEHEEDQQNKVTDEIIKDILAEEEKHRGGLVHEKQDKKFMKRTLIRKIPFSIGNLDVYLHVKYQHVNVFLRCFVECMCVAFLFLIWPIVLIIILPKTRGYNFFSHLSKETKTNPVSEFFRENFFMTLTYFVFIGFSLFMDNILYISAFMLTAFGITVKGKVSEILQVISSSRKHLRNTFVSLIVFLIAIRLVANYHFFSVTKDITYVFLTLIFWFSCFSAILFVETFIMNLLTSELRRKSFRGRIWDTNYKTFIIKKLAAIAEATPYGKTRQNEVIYNLVNDYDTGFFLRHNDLDLNSQEQAKEISEGIFGYLEIQELTFDMIKVFFPDNPKEVFSYLYGSNINEQSDYPSISYDILTTRCSDLYQERIDIARSLYDRDNILRKLDFILTSIVSFFGLIILFVLLDVDYKIYIASVGPFLFGFGWIFQDSIKELYRCFIFHLVNHPFDCGDRVKVDNEELMVLRIDLLYTTYVTVNGKIKYIPNASMFLKNVENIRRSDIQAEDIAITVQKTTTFAQMLTVRDKLSEAVLRLHKDFTGVVYIKNYEVADNGMKVIVCVEHFSNFQDLKPRLIRRDVFIQILEKILDESEITYDHCFVITD